MSPDPFLVCVVVAGNETRLSTVAPCLVCHDMLNQQNLWTAQSVPDPFFHLDLIPRPHHACKERVWGHSRRSAIMWLFVLFVLVHVQSCDGMQDQENAPMSTDQSFSLLRVGSGNVTTIVQWNNTSAIGSQLQHAANQRLFPWFVVDTAIEPHHCDN